ncbi:MAG TPA: hypothetical protein VGG25_08465 [Streptosporangiaceae bacterium]
MMARHRKECPPKRRALVPGGRPGRRVPLSAAIDAARAALESARSDAPADGEPGQPPAAPEGAAAPVIPTLHDQETIELPAATMYPAPVGDEADDTILPGAIPPAPGLPADDAEPVGQPRARRPGRYQRPERATRPPRAPRAGRSRTRPPAGGRVPGGAPGQSRPRMRGLLVTPWFAAGAGFVIAAALALNSPHTVLTYKPNTIPCDNCKSPSPSRGALASAHPGVILRPAKKKPAPGRPEAHGQAAPAGVAVGYRVVWHKDGEFGAIITVPASAARDGWKLSFDIPGTRITGVWGAQWAPAVGEHGGLASVPAPHPAQPWGPGHHGSPGTRGPGHRHPGHGPGGHGGLGQTGSPQSGTASAQSYQDATAAMAAMGIQVQPGLRSQAQLDGDAAGWSQQDVRFLVIAAGNPRTPDICVLNNTACHFG